MEAAKLLDVYVMASAPILQGQLSQDLPAEIRTVLTQETDAQRAIEFVRSTPGIGTVLVGMKQQQHVRENPALARQAPLGPEQFMKLFK